MAGIRESEGELTLVGGSEHGPEAKMVIIEEYRALAENMLNGFAHCKMLFDENNQPVDFVYLEVNDAFERLIGLKREDVIGKKVTEAIPGTRELHPELFSIYGKVALTGEPTQFDLYFVPLGIWLKILVHSPRRGHFVAVFENTTESRRTEVGNMAILRNKSETRAAQMQEKFMGRGFEGFEDKDAIELLLSLALPARKAKRLAKMCIEQHKNLRGFLAASPEELQQTGIPPPCIFYVKLLRELTVRVLKEKIVARCFTKSSSDIFDYLHYSMRDLKKEVFKVIYLDSRSQIIDTADLFEGDVDGILIRPREIIEKTMKVGAVGLVFVHNHPSGDPTPSRSDRQLTRDLVFVGNILQIKVLDHIIIGADGYFSFADDGMIQKYQDNFFNLKIRGVIASRSLYRHYSRLPKGLHRQYSASSLLSAH